MQVSRPRSPGGADRWAAILVSAQFSLLIVLALWPSRALRASPFHALSWLLLVSGAALALVAVPTLGHALTVSPVPKPGAGVRETGIYGWVRHPMYAGVLLAGAGLALRGGSWVHLGALLALVLVLVGKIGFEESRLRQLYPGYADYQRRVGALVPRHDRIAGIWTRQDG